MYRVIKAFTFYLDGINPTEFGEGLHDLPERVAEIAIAEGWAEEATKKPVEVLAKVEPVVPVVPAAPVATVGRKNK